MTRHPIKISKHADKQEKMTVIRRKQSIVINPEMTEIRELVDIRASTNIFRVPRIDALN